MTTGFIYLASGSPRRRALLEQIGVPYRVAVPEVSETRLSGEAPEVYVERLARGKADHVYERVAAREPAPVLAADTVVLVDDELFGKPADEAAALAMLARLSGRSHCVLTAIAVRWDGGSSEDLVSSEVRFRATTAAERLAYCRTAEPYDKAGGYAIQGLGGVFVERLTGSYSAVMGLPLVETARALARFGLPPWLAAGSAGS